MPNTCPSEDELKRYLAGDASDARFERLDDHLAACVDCQTQLEHLASLSEPFCQLVAEAAQTNSPKLPIDLRTALEQIRQNKPRHQTLVPEKESSNPSEQLVQIREYRILSCIGEGGMGCVYHAYDTFLQRPVAIKVLRRERLHKKEAVQRFMREMEVIGNLQHPSIVKALSAGEQDGLHYLVMEYISGVDTYQLRRTIGTLTIADSCEIVVQAAHALDYAHNQQVLHRDIKSSNLIVNANGKVILLDLGLAQFFGTAVDTRISKTDQAVGTLTYMAPEQLAGLRGHSIEADIFSLGATLCEYLLGQKLPLRNADNDLYSLVSDSLPAMPSDLLQLLKSMIATSPKDRPRSMRDVVARMAAFTTGSNLRKLVESYQSKMLQAASCSSNEAVIPPPIQSELTTDKDRKQQETNDVKASTIHHGSSVNRMKKPSGLFTKSENQKRKRAGLAAAAVLLIALPPVVYSVSPWGPFSTTLIATREGEDELPFKTPLSASSAIETIPGTQPNMAAVRDANGNTITTDTTQDVQNMGSIDIVVTDDIPRQLLRDGRVQIENLPNQTRYTLEAGLNQLPPGKYRILIDGPEEFENIEDVSIANGSPRKLNLSAVLRQPFQYPKIPDQVGAFCVYYGTIEHMGLPDKAKIPYTLRLKVLGTEGGSTTGGSSKWLLVEILTQHPTGDLIEKGYLKIDNETWESDKHLKVNEGWVVASSNIISQYMQEYYPNANTQDLVVPFDRNEDLLKTRGSSVLPQTRISLHDFLVLFFGDETILAAHDSIKKLRPEMPNMGERHSWLDTIDAGKGPQECYVVSSKKRPADFSNGMPGFMMARNKQATFGFVELRVVSPILTANCVVKNAEIAKVDPSELQQQLTKIRASAIPANAPPILVGRFDLATLPENGASATWSGRVTVGSGSPQTINATVKVLGNEIFDGKNGRWIHLELDSRFDDALGSNWESAYLLIDEDAFRNHKFQLLKGWIAAQDNANVFAIPSNLDIDALSDERIALLNQSGLKLLGTPEILSMLFNADFTPRSQLTLLRNQIGAAIGGGMRRVTLGQKTLKSGLSIKTQTWEPPKNSNVAYSFVRSKETPFEIVDAHLDLLLPIKVDIDFFLNSCEQTQEATPFAQNFNEAAWINKAQETKARVEKVLEEPNWRVWEWSRQGKVLKVYAEFCGILEKNGAKLTLRRGNNETVLLKNRAGNLLQIPCNILSDDDRKFIDQGRFWKTALSENKQFHLSEMKHPKIELRSLKTNNPHTFSVSSLGVEDKNWVLQLHQTDWDPSATNRSLKDEFQFADYVR